MQINNYPENREKRLRGSSENRGGKARAGEIERSIGQKKSGNELDH
jgi:hypothetical protein